MQCYGIGPAVDLEDGPKGFGMHSDQERLLETELYRLRTVQLRGCGRSGPCRSETREIAGLQGLDVAWRGVAARRDAARAAAADLQRRQPHRRRLRDGDRRGRPARCRT